MKKIYQIFLFSLFLFISCDGNREDNSLFLKFQNPEAEARTMVRWWWNGNAVEADEIKRELAVMKKAGIGGVEINSIAMPAHAKETNATQLQWAGKEWCRMVKVASEEARELGMITDLIVGSGWPFGGRFLEEDETMQRLGIKRQRLEANSTVNIDVEEYLTFKSHFTPGTVVAKETSDVEVISVKLIPTQVNTLDEIIDITSEIKGNKLVYKADDQDYILVFVYNERNFKYVYYGSPGADGPIMDHYKEEVVLSYLNRLKAIEKETGLSLSELIRALFCDSIELGGSNWTDDMKELFKARNGYDIAPYLPFVIQPGRRSKGYEISADMAETLKRVKYDFYNTIISVFLERFTKQFQEFCTENGVLCRYQAYGTPYYMGLFQGNMIPDIPESNNWVYSHGRDEVEASEFTWPQDHGYMLWNKAASSGAHIMGRKITSCEAITNVQGVFRTSLETVKQADDMNFITGMNHAVLHGYNYSPPEAGFPGWIRYGTYFNEQNTWWKYFHYWADYNARLSSVFQNSKPSADIAVLGRLRDFWGEDGPARHVFNNKPWYYPHLWEPISNLGSSCDYIHQPVLENSKIEGNELICGEMRYKALILTDVESLTPVASLKLEAFAKAGGKLVIVGKTPYRSLSFVDANKNDQIVKDAMLGVLDGENVIKMAAPEEGVDLVDWMSGLMRKIQLEPQATISHPVSHLYFMKQYAGDQEIFFFSNSDRKSAVEIDVDFHTGNKIPYIWNPATGERFTLPYEKRNKLHLRLDALESALIVYEPAEIELPSFQFAKAPQNKRALDISWDVKFEHSNGEVFSRKMEQLVDFKSSEDEALRNFAGTATYSTTFENSGKVKYVNLTDVNQGVSELVINGQPAGMKWYGNHCYDITELVKPGTNKVEIKLTNTLANYCSSLKNNPVAQEWTSHYNTFVSGGLEGVELGE